VTSPAHMRQAIHMRACTRSPCKKFPRTAILS
jgi:hypothetical protein